MMNEIRYFGKDNGPDEDHLRKQPTATTAGVLPQPHCGIRSVGSQSHSLAASGFRRSDRCT